ncbi:hypothetical protein TRFO_33687 [Tritrichomonas foetus]|uniref:HECT domain-containing protein n=1 Tax=Tritrichomonas foetus TaxID=1144522 RepID=A0A1J4JL26_9EUKA|nr:hypothetical protein TRFO_33687 [Tritrichomonas foetus]|eukprot:OHS99808.1 hypothetical protein TRFO_33687 [Tritrichomonas foetus]
MSEKVYIFFYRYSEDNLYQTKSMGHEQSRTNPIRGNYDFSSENSNGFFEVGFDEDISASSFVSHLFSNQPPITPLKLPPESIIINSILNPSLFTGNSNLLEIWKTIFIPLFIGGLDTKPHMQQLLASFINFLNDISNSMFINEKNNRTMRNEHKNEKMKNVISLHNPKIKKHSFQVDEKTMNRMRADFNETIKFVSSFLEQRYKKPFCPLLSYKPVSQLICKSLKEVSCDYFAYTTVKWGLAAADMSPIIEGFIELTKCALNNEVSSKRLSFHLLSASLSSLPLSNSVFIPSQQTLQGWETLTNVELPINPTGNLICSDEGSVFVINRGFSIASIDIHSKKGKTKSFTIPINYKRDMRESVFLTSACGYFLIYLAGNINFMTIKTKKFVTGNISYVADGVFGTPKIKPPFASDTHYLYCVDSTKRIAVFSFEKAPKVIFHHFIEFSLGFQQLLVPYDRSLVYKEWLNEALIFTNGIVFTFIILRRAESSYFSYFMRHFSLIDGRHICDSTFVLKWPIISLTVDPWNSCVWAVSPNTNEMNIVKLSLYIPYPPAFLETHHIPIPKYTTIVQSLNESETFETASNAISQFLNYYSIHFSTSSFHGILYNLHYNHNISHTFAPCTNETVNSLISAVHFLKDVILSSKRTKIWKTNNLKIALVTILRLLEYNLQNFETRVDNDNIIQLSNSEEIVNVLFYLLNSSNFSYIHRLISFIFIKGIDQLFSKNKEKLNDVFNLLLKRNSKDFIHFILVELKDNQIFPYCFSSEHVKTIFEPILKEMLQQNQISNEKNVDLISTFQRELFFEMHSIFTTNSLNFDKYQLGLIQVFLSYSELIINHMIDFIKNFRDFVDNQFTALFHRFLLLFQPFTKFTRISASIAKMTMPLFNSLSSKISFNKSKSIIKSDQSGFNLLHQIFFQVFSIFIDSIISLLNGGCELGDPTKYSWLIKATITAKITIKDVDDISTSIFDNIYYYKKESESNSKTKKLLKKGFSFTLVPQLDFSDEFENNIPNPNNNNNNQNSINQNKNSAFNFSYNNNNINDINKNIIANENTHEKHLTDENDNKNQSLFREMILFKENEEITNLFNFLYSSVPNRLSNRLSDDLRHIERVVFAVFMKQLGFSKEIFRISVNLLLNETPVLTNYVRLAMEMLYKIRTILYISRQATLQFISRNSKSNFQAKKPDSIREDFEAYKNEVLRKCIFLLHIQPCLRFQNTSYETAFSDYLKRLENFIVSEISLEQYFNLINASEEARINSSLGLQMINTILTGNCYDFCKYYLIEKLASDQNLFSFLAILKDDSFSESCLHLLLNMLKIMLNLIQENDSSLNTVTVLYLNLILLVQNLCENRIFHPISHLVSLVIKKKNDLQNDIFQSYMALISSFLYIIWTKDKIFGSDERFFRIFSRIIPENEPILTNIHISRIYFRITDFPIKYSLNSLINLLITSKPIYSQSICSLIGDFVNRNPSDITNYFWILSEIAKICCGTSSEYHKNLPCFAETNLYKHKIAKTPGILLAVCSDLIQLCRSFLVSKNDTFFKILEHILTRSFTSGVKKNEMSLFDSPILLFAVFAILSNVIDVIRVNSFVKLNDLSQTYFISEMEDNSFNSPLKNESKNDINHSKVGNTTGYNYNNSLNIVNNSIANSNNSRNHFKGWQIPINNLSEKKTLSLDQVFPIPAIPFTYSMFPFTDSLFPLFLAQFDDQPSSICEEALSFYVLSSLKEYCNDINFLNLFLRQLPKVNVSQIVFGNSKINFLALLRAHLTIDSDGFLPNIQTPPRCYFFYSSPSNNPQTNQFALEKSVIRTVKGVSVFVSNLLKVDQPTSVTLQFSNNSRFDCGMQTFSSNPNGSQALLLLAHNYPNEVFVISEQVKILSKVPIFIILEYSPSTHQGSIINAQTGEKIASTYFCHNIVSFVLYLYGESYVNYSFSDNNHNKSKLSQHSVSNFPKLPSLERSPLLTLDDKKWSRFTYSQEELPTDNSSTNNEQEMNNEPVHEKNIAIKDLHKSKKAKNNIRVEDSGHHFVTKPDQHNNFNHIIISNINKYSIVDYPLSTLNKIEPSLQTITRSMIAFEPVMTSNVSFEYCSYIGINLLNNRYNRYAFKSNDKYNLMNIIFDAKDGIHVNDFTGEVSLINTINSSKDSIDLKNDIINNEKYKTFDFLPPIHYLNFGILPPQFLNYFLLGIVPKFRDEMKSEILMRIFASPSINVPKIMEKICPSTESLIYFVVSLLVYIEPITISNNRSSIIDFNYNSLDGKSNLKSSNLSFHRSALNHLVSYMCESDVMENSIETWFTIIKNGFASGYSHSVCPSHPHAVVINYQDLRIKPSNVYHKNAVAWVVLPSCFNSTIPINITTKNIKFKNEVFDQNEKSNKNDKNHKNSHSSTHANNYTISQNDTVPYDKKFLNKHNLVNNVVCIEGDAFTASYENNDEDITDQNFYKNKKDILTGHYLACIPIFQDDNESLFGTFLDLILSLKYFVIFYKLNSSKLRSDQVKEYKKSIYEMFLDSVVAHSPFFVRYGGDLLQFLQTNIPLESSDLTEDFIQRLSLLSIYTEDNELEFIHRFIEEQQNVLDEIYIFGGQDFINDIFNTNSSEEEITMSNQSILSNSFTNKNSPSTSTNNFINNSDSNFTNSTNTSNNKGISNSESSSSINNENNSKLKLFESPFPDEVSSNDNSFSRISSNLKRLLLKRKDVHSCPFHLLLHRWTKYAQLYPSTELKIINETCCRIKFSFYVPKTYKIVWKNFPEGIFASFDPDWNNMKDNKNNSKDIKDKILKSSHNPKNNSTNDSINGDQTNEQKSNSKGDQIKNEICYNESNLHEIFELKKDTIFTHNSSSEIYLIIKDDKGTINFSDLLFYVQSLDNLMLDDFVRFYRSQFVLDAKLFFIHWETRHDQSLLNCFPVKIFYRSHINLDFDPMKLLSSRINFPLHILCCRCYFILLLNFYFTHARSEFSKDLILHQLISSVMMKIKIEKFRKLIYHSNGTEGDYIRINRKAAFEVRDGQSKKLSHTLISQLTAVYTSPVHFRVASDKPWKVHLIGEQGCDVGGLARELVAEAAVDLITPACGLVTEIPDFKNDYENASNFVIPIANPHHHKIKEQYKFAGALIAIAIRSQLPQDFNFSPLVWEFLMNGHFSLERIYEIDHNFYSLINSLRQAMKSPSAGSIIERFNLNFVIKDSTGADHLLIPNGYEEKVKYSNCESFISLACEFRMNEMRSNLEAMREGLWENFNMKTPKYLDWETLEFAACGEKEVSIDVLKRITVFYDVPDDQQKMFWDVIEKLTSEQRSLLLKFATGRVRFPSNVSNNHFMKIDFSIGEIDKMPTATTCFNQLHLPKYTSFDTMFSLVSLAIEYTGTFEMG